MVKMENNINIKMIFDIINKKKWIIIAILLLFTMLGYFYTAYAIVPEYKATETMILVFNNDVTNNADLVLNSNLMSTYTSLVKESKVLNQVIQNLDLNITEQQLANKIQVENPQDTYVIQVSVTDENPQMTVLIANEITNVFMEQVGEIYNLRNIEILNQAEVPQDPFNQNYLKNIGIFFGIGAILSAVYIFIIFNFDNTIKTEEEIENYLHIKVLSGIPLNGDSKQKSLKDLEIKPYIAECMNIIRTNILYMNSMQKGKTVLITSCNPSEGKSWVSANLSTSFAKLHKKVLLIDADMRKGRIHQIFGLNKMEGLSDYLCQMQGNLKEDILLGKKYIKETSIPNLHILSSGLTPPNPSELLNSSKMKQLLGILRNIYDVIIIDAPPCKVVTDSIILATMVDSIVLVVKAEQTKMKELQEVQKSLETVGGKIIGAILNQQKVKQKTYQSSYLYEKVEKEKKDEDVLYLPETTKENAITVETILEEAVNTIKPEDLKENAQVKSTKRFVVSKKNKAKNDFREMIEKQNEQLEQIKSTISKLEVQTNNNKLDNKIEKDKLEQLITNQIEQIKGDYATQLETMKNDYDIQIKTIKSDCDIQLETVKKDMYTESNRSYAKQFKYINHKIKEMGKNYPEHLKQLNDKVLEISENQSKQLNDKILEINENQSKQLNEKILEINENQSKQAKQFDDKVAEISQNYIEQTKQLNDKILEINENQAKQLSSKIAEINQKQLEELKQLEEQITKNNQEYSEQIKQLDNRIEEMNQNYLELYNNMNLTSEKEIEKEDNSKIIDIKLFNKKKKVYSINEDISYYDLEKNAIKVITIKPQEANQIELRA